VPLIPPVPPHLCADPDTSPTQTSLWLREALASTFNITERLSASNADRLYDVMDAALKSDQFKPAALLDAWNIRVLATTNGATDPLLPHVALSRQPAMRGRIIPTFRPDDVCDLRHTEWRQRIAALRELTSLPVATFDDFLAALRARRAEFKRLGATASDHGVAAPVTTILAHDKVRSLFSAALAGKAVSPEDGAAFTAHMLVEHARMSAADGLVMQLHAGVHRNHHPGLFASCGPDIGADIPVAADWTGGLQPLLGELGTHPNLTLVVFTLDEATYSRELGPLAGFYPVLKLGPPWWFHDSLHGMRRYLDGVVDSAGVANLAGFNDDARNFLTLQARHTLWRRAVADWVATQHVAGILDWVDALQVAKDLALNLAVRTYKLEASRKG
jgi:glucuronate isomerase